MTSQRRHRRRECRRMFHESLCKREKRPYCDSRQVPAHAAVVFLTDAGRRCHVGRILSNGARFSDSEARQSGAH